MSTIVDIIGREVLDSRDNLTVECDVLLESSVMGRAVMPSDASTGSHEVIGLHDGGKSHYLGKGVLRAIEYINTEIPEVIMGLDAPEQMFLNRTLIDLDGTENKSRLGASAVSTASMAVAKAAAEEVGLPLYRYFGGSGAIQIPMPMANTVNGGAHVDNSLDIQKFMVMPVDQPGFHEALRYDAEAFHVLKKILAGKGMDTAMGDEGGLALDFASNEECLNTILSAVEQAGYKAGEDVLLVLGCTASEFYKDGKHHLEGKGLQLSSEDFVNYLANPADKFPIVSIESGIHESDWAGWKVLTEKLGKKVQLVGSDLFVTNIRILKEGIEKGTANSILIKISQIGTLTETLTAIGMAKRAGYTAVISHRSGETEDSTITDIAVSANADQIRTDSLSRSDRMAKYNQLLRIKEDLGDIANYPGKSAFYNL